MKFSHSFSALLLLVTPFSAFADGSIGRGTWLGDHKMVEVQDEFVKLDEDTYHFGGEEISKAYGVGSDSGDLCKAVTLNATRARDGEIVLVRAIRTKKSHSGGLLCSFSTSVGSYDEPFEFTQYVITPGKDGKMKLRTTLVFGKDQPAIKAEERLDPNLALKNEALKKYMAKQQKEYEAENHPLGWGTYSNTTEALLSEHASPKGEISAGDQLGDEVYGATGHKSLMTPEGRETAEKAEAGEAAELK